MYNRLLTIAASSAFFGFIGYVGLYILRGNSFGSATHGILSLPIRILNSLIDTLGFNAVGSGIIVFAVFGGIYAAIRIWRDSMF